MTAYGELLLLPSEMCSNIIDEHSYRNHPWCLPNNQSLRYVEVINYSRRYCLDQEAHNCVMCGKHNVIIPSQNKDVCKTCDSNCWYNPKLNVVFKFCKGCKNFFALEEFREKPEASKCGKCRKRGRANYVSKKLENSYSYYNTEEYNQQRRGSIDCNIIGEDYVSSNSPSVTTIEEEEDCNKESPSSSLSNVHFMFENSSGKESTYRRPPKVPKRNSPCSETRNSMIELGTPNGKSREDSLTQLYACGEQLDSSPTQQDELPSTKRQRMMTAAALEFKLYYTNTIERSLSISSNNSGSIVNVVTPSAPTSVFRSHSVTDSPISALHLAVSPPENCTNNNSSNGSVGIRSASPYLSILKGHNKENSPDVCSESIDKMSSSITVTPEEGKTSIIPIITSRSRQVSFSGESSPLKWDPSVDPLLNLAVLVSSATAENI